MKNNGIYFLSIEISGFRCFKEKVKLNLADNNNSWKKWTILLGDNGTGKTSLLQALSNFQIERIDYQDDYLYFPKSFNSDLIKDAIFEARVIKNTERSKFRYSYGEDSLSSKTGTVDKQYEELVCYGYGATRFMSFASLADTKSENSETLFNTEARLINAEEWLLQLDYAASKKSDVQNYAESKRIQVESILKQLLPDVKEIRISSPTKNSLKSTVEFSTPYGWVSIHHLSLGYKTMVAWMVDLAARLFERYPESENPLKEPAIVLVDEIDLHLHPKWQRKIFDHLDSLFPKTQFIVTAHSPLVVQSAPKDANIVLLRREGNHVVVDQDIDSVNSWRLDQILTSDLFGLDSARGAETEDLLLERKKLLQKKRLTVKDKKRLEELNIYAHNLPSAESKTDIEAMEIIRRAAGLLQTKGK